MKLADISFERTRDTGPLNKELNHLAEWAGTKVQGKAGPWHMDGDPIIEGNIQGFPFRALYLMHRSGFGGIIMFPSISPEKIVITTYFAYQHEFYVYLLEQMAGMAEALARL